MNTNPAHRELFPPQGAAARHARWILCRIVPRDVLLALSTQKEEFEQIAAAKIDILWVVDNSQSMAKSKLASVPTFKPFISSVDLYQVRLPYRSRFHRP